MGPRPPVRSAPGMMEFYSRKFRDVVDMVLDSQKTVVATLSKRLVGEYQSRGEALERRRNNFDEVYAEVLRRLKTSLLTY